MEEKQTEENSTHQQVTPNAVEKPTQLKQDDSTSPISQIENFEPKSRDSPKLGPEKAFSDDAFEDNFDFNSKSDIPPAEPSPKAKLSDKEIKLLRLQLENAEYLQLKSLLQAKINSEQFEIVKLRSHVALRNKQEGNLQTNKENKKIDPAEEQELKQKLLKENNVLVQKIHNLNNQIFQEKVACIQLKVDLAMKEIL